MTSLSPAALRSGSLYHANSNADENQGREDGMDAPESRPYARVRIPSPLRGNRIEQARETERVGNEVGRLWMPALPGFDAEADAYVATLCGRGWAFWSVVDVLQRQ
jgi:hypothetical protein